MADETTIDVVEKEMTPLERMRHSGAHVMAEAVVSLFPEAKLGIGPPIENGFYYDFDLSRSLNPEDLEAIAERMRASIAADKPFECRPVSKEEAIELFRDQPYKLELIEDFGEGNLTVYQHGDFVDLCRGPHVRSTGELGPFALTHVAGAYWRGDEKRPMLQRIYGTMWESEQELEDYQRRLELARERDHRKLGRELGLFVLSPDVGPGIPLFLPKGATLRHLMESYVRELQRKVGYKHVWTAHLAKHELFERSGHAEKYAETMFPPMRDEGEVYQLKPMNCPSHMTLFNSEYHSYRDLPLGYSEFATLYRYEKSGELVGLSRVRALTQDDTHVFCTPDQIQAEFARALGLIRTALATYGIDDYWVELSLHDPNDPSKVAGDEETWIRSEREIREALDRQEARYEPVLGEAAFYGPKADFFMRDVLGRKWQGPTIQIDFIQPARLGCEYIGEDGQPHTPVVIHTAVTGSTERFMAMLIEHFGGAFPTWLSPIQVMILPIADRHLEYAHSLRKRLDEAGIRVEVDERSERLNLKIRDAQLQKIPYVFVVGDKEIESNSVSVRVRGGKNLGSMPVEEFEQLIGTEIETKALKPAAEG